MNDRDRDCSDAVTGKEWLDTLEAGKGKKRFLELSEGIWLC